MSGRDDLSKQTGASSAEAAKVKLGKEILFLEPDMIEPDPEQPREECDEEGLARLADSLRKFGQLNPVLVRRAGNKYRLVTGERRWRAAKLARMPRVKAVLCEGGDTRSIQLVENLLREDLKPVEQARAFAAIMEQEGWSARELARRLSLDQSGISRALKLLDLPEEVREAVDRGEIPPTTAYEISRRPREEQARLARQAMDGLIKGDDLRRREPTSESSPASTMEVPSPWIFRHGKVTITVTGHRSLEQLIAALKSVIEALSSEIDGQRQENC